MSGTVKALSDINTVTGLQLIVDDVVVNEAFYSPRARPGGSSYYNDERTLGLGADLTVGSHRVKIFGATEMGTAGYSDTYIVTVTASSVNNATFVRQTVPSTLEAGKTYSASVTMRNSGSSTWTPGGSYPYRLGTPAGNNFISAGRIELTSSVAPGAEYTFPITLTPQVSGQFTFQWQMLQEEREWFGDRTPSQAVNVITPQPTNNATFVRQSSIPTSIEAGKTYSVSVTMKNTGTTTWAPGGTHPYRLGTQSPANNSNLSSGRIELSSTVAPGAEYTFPILLSPQTTGTFTFQWQMVQEDLEWFGEMSTSRSVSVTSPTTANPITASIDSPSSDQTVASQGNGVSISFSGKASPSTGASITSLILTDNGTQFASASGAGVNTTAPITSTRQLTVGVHTIILKATDSSGASKSVTRTITVTGQAPTVAFTNPTSDVTLIGAASGLSVAFSGSATAATGSTISNLSLRENGVAFATATNTTQISGSKNLSIGVHAIELIATDNNGMSSTVTRTVTVTAPSSTGPTLTINAPMDGSSFNAGSSTSFGLSIAINATAVSGSTVNSIAVYLDNSSTPVAQSTNNMLNSSIPVPPGAHTLKVTATDNKGGSTSKSVNFNVTGISPTVNLTSPVDKTTYLAVQSATVNITGTVNTNGGSAISTIEVLDNDVVIATAAGKTSYAGTVDLAVGTHILKLRAKNAAGIQALSSAVAVTVNAVTEGDSAQFVSQDVPSQLKAAQPYTIIVRMLNSGSTTWTPSGSNPYRLGAVNPIDNRTWNVTARGYLKSAVAPGAVGEFTIPISAPQLPGTYNMQWRMLKEKVKWFGDTSANVAITVGASSGVTTNLIATPTNVRVSGTLTAAIKFDTTVVSVNPLSKLELLKGTDGTDYSVQSPAASKAVSGFNQTWSTTLNLPAGIYFFKVRVTDPWNAQSDSASVMVNVTNSALLGTISGVRTNVAGTAELFGWACQSGNSTPLNYKVLLDAPSQDAGGTVLTSGTANTNTEADNASVASACGTPGVGHHFVVDLSSYIAQYAGRRLYVWAETADASSTVSLPCAENSCTMPGALRVALTTPKNGDRIAWPNPVFMRMQLTNASGNYDEVGFVVNGTYIPAQSDTAAGAYYASINTLNASTTPYTVFAKARQGGTTVMSMQNQFYLLPLDAVTIGWSGLNSGATFPVDTPQSLRVMTTGISVYSVKFFAAGTLLGNAIRSDNNWNLNWSPSAVGKFTLLARAYDSSGNQLAESTAIEVTVTANDAAPVPIVVTVPQLNNAVGGTLPGQVMAGSDGSATYSIPIQLPPGVMGMVPNINLSYSSNNPNGLAGLGWQLGGISQIDRCGKVIATDGKGDAVRFTNNEPVLPQPIDRLCLDGMRLISVYGSAAEDNEYWANGAEYRTEIESFTRVTALQINGRKAFKVETKDGRISYYGDTSDSYIEGVGRTDQLAHRWYVSRVEDRSGNTISYKYTEDAATGEVTPAQISWGKNSAAATKDFARVVFTYETRPDPRIAYLAGSRIDSRKRLKTIATSTDTSGNGAEVWNSALTYTLDYSVSPSSGRSRLDSVAACDAQGCLPATTFAWGEPIGASQRGFVPLGAARTGPNLQALVNATFFGYSKVYVAADFNGDGKTDLLEREYSSTAGTQHLYESNPDGLGWTIRTPFKSDVARVLETGDFDGDGLLDVLVLTINTQWSLCFGKERENGTYNCRAPLILPGGVVQRDDPLKNLRLARDFNADGKDDLYLINDPDRAIRRAYQCLSNGVTFNCIDVTGTVDEKDIGDNFTGEPFGPSAYTDIDGDGRVDVIVIPKCQWIAIEPSTVKDWHCGDTVFGANGGVAAYGQPERGGVSVSGGWLPFSSSNTGVAPPMGSGTLVGDVNGDGYSDMLMGVLNLTTRGTVTGGGGHLCLSKGNGEGDCRPLPSTNVTDGVDLSYLAMTVGDFDGDGVIDVLRPKNDVWNNAHVTGYRLCHLGTDTAVAGDLPLFQRCDDWSGPQFYTANQKTAYLVPEAAVTIPMSMFLGDFDGDGRQDIATYLGGDQWQIYTAARQAKENEALDRLITVTNGLNHVERIDYALSNDSSVYKPDVSRPDGQNLVGKLTVPGRPLVKAIHRNSGVAGIRDTTYSYSRFALDSEGRGALGFAQLTMTDVQSGIVSVKWPCLSFPFIGAECAGREAIGNVELSSTVNAWQSKSYSQPSAGRTTLPYLSSSSVSKHDPNGNDLGTKTTTNSKLDDWGNIGETIVKNTSIANKTGWSITRNSTYDNDQITWRIGELKTQTETRTNDFNTISRQISYSYDSAGRLSSETRESNDDAQRLKTAYDRTTTKFGMVGKTTLSWTDVNGAVQSRVISDVTFTPNGRFISSTKNAANQIEQRNFDSRTGTQTTVTTSNGLITTTASDGFGRVIGITTPDGNTVETYYKRCDKNCPVGAGMVEIRDTKRSDGARSAVPVLRFADTAGQVMREVTWGFDGRYLVMERVYDVFGRVKNVYWPRYAVDSDYLTGLSANPAGAILQTASSYDALDRVLTQQSVAEDGAVLTTTHTWTGFKHETKNPKNQTISETTDLWGKLASTVDANGKQTTFSFDAFGNLTVTVDPLGNQVKVSYDAWGRRTRLDDPDLGLTTYDINPLGQTWRQISPKQRTAGKSTLMTYDVLGRMITRTAEDVSATWTYDQLPGQANCATAKSCGKLVQAATLSGTSALDYHQEFTYDQLGRPDTTTRYLDVPYRSKSTYDAWGRVSRVEYQRDSETPKVYDHRYNAWGWLARIERKGVALWTATELDASSRVTKATLGNGLALVSAFNPNTGRLTDGTVKAQAVQRLHEAYQYDVLGNVSQRLQEWGGSMFTENFDYDQLNRLKSSTISGRAQQSFTYDDLGNLKSKTGVGSGDYLYPGAGSKRPHAVTSIPSVGAFAYDDNGNLVSGAGRTMTWTSFDMPLTIAKGSATSAFYYGADRERVKQVRSDNVTVWYAGAMEIETNGSNVKVKTYLPNNLGVEIENAGSSKIYYAHHDRLGSVMALSDEAGVLSEQLAYDAWGKRREQTTPVASDNIDGQLDNKGFTGHEMLDKVDLVHMNGRVYDPFIARFISPDILIQDPQHSQSYNRYTYVWNNPTNLTDPTGFVADDKSDSCNVECRRQIEQEREAKRCSGNIGCWLQSLWSARSASKDSKGGNGATNSSAQNTNSANNNVLHNGGGAADRFVEQYRKDMESGNGDIYKPFEPYAVAVAGAMAVGPGSGFLATTSFGRAFLTMFGIGAEIQGMADGVPSGLRLFKNLAPADEVIAAVRFPASQVQKVAYSGRLAYVVMPNGELVIGRTGHISLSRGADVLAAGEVKFVNGAVRSIDNASGHYKPMGESAKQAAEAAFNRNGFDAVGKYTERKF